MTPEQREHWRWTYAGQAMTHMHWPEAIPYKLMAERSIHIADALIAELEKTAWSFNGSANAKLSVACANNIDKLLAVVKAVEAVCLDWDFEGGGVTNGLHIELNEALAALEEG